MEPFPCHQLSIPFKLIQPAQALLFSCLIAFQFQWYGSFLTISKPSAATFGQQPSILMIEAPRLQQDLLEQLLLIF